MSVSKLVREPESLCNVGLGWQTWRSSAVPSSMSSAIGEAVAAQLSVARHPCHYHR